MASSSSELTLDLRPAAAADLVPKAVGVLLRGSSGARRRELLEEYVKRLEEERRKIDGFRRELPLCMLLISDGRWSFFCFFDVGLWVGGGGGF